MFLECFMCGIRIHQKLVCNLMLPLKSQSKQYGYDVGSELKGLVDIVS